jgi:hypothetical protein
MGNAAKTAHVTVAGVPVCQTWILNTLAGLKLGVDLCEHRSIRQANATKRELQRHVCEVAVVVGPCPASLESEVR